MMKSPDLSAMCHRCATLPILLLALLLLSAAANAERDFNVNDSQVPVIEPKDAPAYKQDPYVTELMRCQHSQSEIVLSLLLRKHDWSDLSTAKRAHVQSKLSKFFAIPREFITLDSVAKRELTNMHKLAMRKGGKGQKQLEALNHRLGRASFMIGCGANYFSMGEPIAKQIAHQIKDGTIGALTEENFGLWFIWRKELKSRSQRKRRQSEGSGAEEDDYDYGDDDEEQAPEPVTVVPTTHAHRHHHGVAGDAVDALEAAAAGNGSSVPILTSNELDAPLASPIPATTRQPLLDTSSSTTTTDSSTDYVEPRQENTTPIIKMRLQKLAVTSGKAFSFVVPMETFHDAEDQSNLRLELTDKDGHELKASSWLQFNADKRELYGLPLDDAVSRWTYRLSATDSGNASVTETVEIAVQQHRAVRTINHEITIAVRINEKLGHNIDWQLKLIRAVAHTLGDGSSSALVVREIRQTSQEPQSASFVYFNETLPTSECPEVELKDVVRRLNAERLSDLVLPLLSIQSITGQLIGTCQKTELNKVKPTTQMAKNLPPMPRNQVDRVSATVGQLLVYKVPSDTFYDPNDNELTLSLKTKDHKEISPRNWMQFDSKNQEFYGIPKGSDTGTEEYLLIAEDSGGLSANDALVVVVSNAQRKELAMNFKAYLAIKHENFNAELQRKFVERIAQLNGDSNTNQVLVRTINQNHDQDGVIVYFYNASLYKMNNRCPHKEMEDVRSVYFDSDLKLKPAVRHALGAELNLTQMSAMTSSVCQYTDSSDINSLDNLPPNHKEPSLKPTSPEEYLATFILPAVIIVVMIILASIIACCLHRRRHKSGKMELGDEEERKSFRTKGIPVIFQDEFEEKPEIGNKSPVILKDEKPPLLPPSYNTSNMNGDNDVDEYVPPPAVVLGGREVRGKSPATPSYRKPPPYVSP
ncbi:uncharacterized protein LOC133846151 isoform X3 [Drosophila sulfurigaster albostrigata]|uniref:uncharacterized protein LOC133846151 isoform X3 n=1 Tax=Drosophila sulfurigaster albostrigata TaxID=89887 RepID=UPI002D21DDAE|nr:uncharacterized protein LOC133846151 isoform X3 [Drosophila sulfurigaster albostrigata]